MGKITRTLPYLLPFLVGIGFKSIIDLLFVDITDTLKQLRIEIVANDQNFVKFKSNFYQQLSHCMVDNLGHSNQNELLAIDHLSEGGINEILEYHSKERKEDNHQNSIEELLKSKNYQPPQFFKPKNEYEVTRWDFVDVSKNNVYSTDVLGLGEPRVGLNGKFLQEKADLEKQLGIKIKNFYRREDIYRGIDYMIDTIQSEPNSISQDFESGQRIHVLKPLIPGYKILSKTSNLENSQQTIKLIMPVSKVADRLKKFLENFQKSDFFKVDLILVSMSKNPPASDGDVERLVSRYNKKANIKVVNVDEEFNRGRALNLGANLCNRLDILFFMDVDILFDQGTLNRCRANAIPDKQVWFPIVWNQYDPKIITDGNPPGRDPQTIFNERTKEYSINRWTGFWIHYGFGMICLYKSDFDGVGKFPEIAGWGGEDVGIYRNFISNNYKGMSDLEIIHSVDPGMIHVYHDRSCDQTKLTQDQYRMCMGASSETLGNKQQMATLYMKSQGLL